MYNGKSAFSSVVWALLLGICSVTIPVFNSAHAQGVPQSIQDQLSEMSPEEARREAIRLGLDLNDPEAAIARARELGVPESLVQQMLDAIASEEEEEEPGLQPGMETDRDVPQLNGRPIFFPEQLVLSQETQLRINEEEDGHFRVVDTVQVRVPIRDDLSGIKEVEMHLFNDAQTDTVTAEVVRRVLGSKYEGMWQGDFYIHANVEADNWNLFVHVTDEQGNDNIIDTEESFPILRPGQTIVEEDSTMIEEELKFFGYELFAAPTASFEPVSNAPVDAGYLVGPGDELRLIMFGAAEFQHDLIVDNEGRIFVPNVGQRTVAGNRLDALRSDLRIWLAQSYAGLIAEPPDVLMDLSVTRLKPVNVFVLGEVSRPGRFPLPSNSSVFNALYSVGGPETSGSLRDIRVIRHGSQVYSVDMYEYLLSGYSDGDARLQSGDNVFIPPRGKTVTIDGEVHRPAIYELKDGETFKDLLAYAGGLKAEAYTQRFQIERVIPFEEREDPLIVREVFDYDLAKVLKDTEPVEIADGDVVTIFAIPDATNLAAQRQVRSVSVTGAVFSPGRYQISGDVRTLRDLVGKANGLTGDAYYEKIELYRLTDKLKKEVVSLNLNEVMNDIPTQNLVLQPQDSLHIFSLNKLIDIPQVRISGQVRNTGEFDLLENMTIVDLLYKGGGLADPEFMKGVFPDRADLFRVSEDGRSEEIIPFHLGDALSGKGDANKLLQAGDEIRIYPLNVEVPSDLFVTISGAIKEEGTYRYREGMTLEDLILQAGGFEEGAFLNGVEVTRVDSTRENTELATSILVPFMSYVDTGQPTFSLRPDGNRDKAASEFVLQHLDRIYVRKDPNYRQQQTVTVTGEVQFPGSYTLLRENETLTEIIRRAGGVLPSGYLEGGRLIRENLQVIVQMDKAITGDYSADIVLLPGDEIIVPLQPNTVAVRGNVANEGLIKFEPGRRVTYYLDRAGGLRTDTESILLTQASGATFRVKRRGLFKSNPVVDEGALVLVTRKPPKEPGEGVDISRAIVDGLAILSSTMTIIVLANQAFNN
ncbi:MAG: SLBB domain-containing protein [Rhodothermaceae bacterium]|nr:SLBB domain-containing protein [Rhodothermaceae bacterium]